MGTVYVDIEIVVVYVVAVVFMLGVLFGMTIAHIATRDSLEYHPERSSTTRPRRSRGRNAKMDALERELRQAIADQGTELRQAIAQDRH